MQQLPPALSGLAAHRQFLLYKVVPSPTRPGKHDKFPVSPATLQVVNAHDPAHWVDAATACARATQTGLGVAFVFTPAAGLFFLDIDGALDPTTGQWSPVAQQLAQVFQGAAMELSHSQTGMHIFGRYQGPLLHRSRNQTYGLELYTSLRFVALTGLQAGGSVDTDHTQALQSVVAAYFPPDGATGASGDFTLSTEPVPEWRGPTDDDELIRRAMMSRSAAGTFGGKANFRDLWVADADVLAATYPDPGAARAYGESEADMALAAHLGFWTGRHGERIERLMQRSALKREKWDRDDYLPRTIARALAKGGDVYQEPAPTPSPVAPLAAPPAGGAGPAMSARGGTGFISTAGVGSFFAGCVYIKGEGRVYVPGSGRLKSEQFRVVFGGNTFGMDNANQRTSRNAWEAFTESQVLKPPMADEICFKPDLPPGHVIHEAGRSRVNIYEPVRVARTPGDASRFWLHLSKLLPDERDRTILMSYLAACVQHAGVKFQWAPLIQGVEGNGKTLLTRCVAEAVGRKYVHWPKASKLSKEFNAWMVGKLLYGVEDVFVVGGREDVLEELKPMITGGDGLEIEGKGVDQISMDICGNFVFNSNHKDGIRKTKRDRRYAPFFCAQQQFEDLARDGMDGSYMPSLYNWLRLEGGYAVVSELLHTWAIPAEFNPAKDAHRAPETTSTQAAIASGLGSVEQLVLEAIEQGTLGFMGGWVSSIQLGILLENMRGGARMSLSKRGEMLRALGYVLHPGLPDGRVSMPVMPDGKKTQLYIRQDHVHLTLTEPIAIAKAYSDAQVVR